MFMNSWTLSLFLLSHPLRVIFPTSPEEETEVTIEEEDVIIISSDEEE